jgi:hypothetical protein
MNRAQKRQIRQKLKQLSRKRAASSGTAVIASVIPKASFVWSIAEFPTRLRQHLPPNLSPSTIEWVCFIPEGLEDEDLGFEITTPGGGEVFETDCPGGRLWVGTTVEEKP